MDKEKRRAYYREYNQRPEVKARVAKQKQEYNQRPEVKERRAEYLKEYNQRPEVKARKAEYQRAYSQRPEVKARRAARSKEKKLESLIARLQAEGYTVQKEDE